VGIFRTCALFRISYLGSEIDLRENVVKWTGF